MFSLKFSQFCEIERFIFKKSSHIYLEKLKKGNYLENNYFNLGAILF